MDIAVTGSSGLIGTALVERLRGSGHRVIRVVRGRGGSDASDADTVTWDPMEGSIDAAGFEGLDAVVHLAGETIGAGRWNDEKKRRILESRARGTTLLAQTLAQLDAPPSALLSASGAHFYARNGEDEVTEASPAGSGFLADVVVAWEDSTKAAAAAGIRTVTMRSGVVLTDKGGALAKQLPLFRFGLGGRLGSGKQHLSWISLPDEVGAIVHLLTADLDGPVNTTAPEPVTNAEFTKTLGRVLGRPTALPVPPFGPRLLLGREMADELLFTSIRALPTKLLGSGYEFGHPTLEVALRAVLDRPAPTVAA